MLAAVMHGRRDIRLQQAPVPTPGPGEVLIEVTSVGVCGTDAAEWSNGPRLFPIDHKHPVTGHMGPMILGHEFGGRIVERGAGVPSAWQGRLVASCGAMPCGDCLQCATGRSNLCRRYAAVGLHRDGALATFVTAPVESCFDAGTLGLREDDVALPQPMAIAVHAMRRSGVRRGDTAIVQGVGGIGAFLIFALVDAGAHVVATDLSEERLTIARRLGAHVAILGGTEGSASAIADQFPTHVPIFFEVTGSDAGLKLALDVVPMGTNIVMVGIQKAPRAVDFGVLTVRELSIIGTNAMVRETDFPEAVRLISARDGGWADVAPAPLPLSSLIDGALRPMAEGMPPSIKTLIKP